MGGTFIGNLGAAELVLGSPVVGHGVNVWVEFKWVLRVESMLEMSRDYSFNAKFEAMSMLNSSSLP